MAIDFNSTSTIKIPQQQERTHAIIICGTDQPKSCVAVNTGVQNRKKLNWPIPDSSTIILHEIYNSITFIKIANLSSLLSLHWKKKLNYFDLKSWVTGENKFRPGTPSNWDRVKLTRYWESNCQFEILKTVQPLKVKCIPALVNLRLAKKLARSSMYRVEMIGFQTWRQKKFKLWKKV